MTEASGNTDTGSDRRVVLIADAQTHMMHDLALEMARRGHNIVIGPPADGLDAQLKELGAEVEAVAADDALNAAAAALDARAYADDLEG